MIQSFWIQHGKTLRWLIAFFSFSSLAILVWSCGPGGPDVSRLSAYQPGTGTILLDRNGEPLAEISPVNRRIVELASLPEYVPNAFIAVEDQRFWKHHGIDVWRMGGAVVHNLRRRELDEGFSTITMQLARNVFPEQIRMRDRTIGRKLAEMRAALSIESKFSKKEILELYLNHIYFGNGAFGIEAASRHYFRKASSDLKLSEAALLAALPKAPNHYDPRRFADKARERRNLVLSRLEKQGLVTPEEAEAARRDGLGVRAAKTGGRPGEEIAGYFIMEIRRLLEEKFGDEFYSRRLRVSTTLDPNLQAAAEEELGKQLSNIEEGRYGRYRGGRYAAGREITEDSPPYLQGAIVALDVTTGDVLAWVGGRDIRQSAFDHVSNARRQAGSAFKPFVYAAALAEGTPLNRRLEDEPLRIELARNRYWEPKNFSGGYEGLITMREALVRSINVATVRLAEEVGYDRISAVARGAGIQSPIEETPSMALGTVAVSPLELTGAYTTFAGLGRRAEPRLITRVETMDGQVLMTVEPETRDALDPSVAYLVNDALHDAILHGSGAPAMSTGFAGPAAGKTGTTTDGVDAWFIGYTPEVVAGVWIGFDQPRRIVPGASGGRLAAPVWGRLMSRYYQNSEPAWWRAPRNVVEYAIDPETGDILEDGCWPLWGEPGREVFIRGTEPPTICPGGENRSWDYWAYGNDGDSGRYEGGDFEDERTTGADLDGWWELRTVVTSTAEPALEGRRTVYNVHLRADGDEITGQGLKTSEDGLMLDGRERTPISVEGRIRGNTLRLDFTEYGDEGMSTGWFDYSITGNGLVGDFRCVSANFSGSSEARRSY